MLQDRQVSRARKGAHHKPLDPTADFDLVARRGAKINAGAQRHGVGDHELAGISLRETFDAACRVDGIADRRDGHRRAVAHFTDDSRPGMNSDADP